VGWVTRKEYCKREGIKFRAFKYRKKGGQIQWRYAAGFGRGGEGGKHVEVWIPDTENQRIGETENQRGGESENRRNGEPEKKYKDRYKVYRGEPGASIVTPLIDGLPAISQSAKGTAAHSEKNMPALLTPPQLPCETSPTSQGTFLPARANRIANLRYAILQKFQEELTRPDPNLPLFQNGSNGHRSKTATIKKFLDLYNSGLLLPDIHREIPRISRATLYNWLAAADQDGINALIPGHGRAGTSKITEHEKNLLLTLCLDQNRLKIAYAISLTKEYLKKKNFDSPSSPATLRRFIDQFKKERYDIWVLRREGEKASNDKVLPYAERDPNLLEVGEGLVADGHRLNFQIVNPITGKPGRAALVLFWDWRSSYPLGWEIMIEENIQCVASALRNAILALGKIPKWIYLDNGKAFKAKIFTEDLSFDDTELPGMFARLNINCHFAQPYNAQSKPIERIFGILNEQFERLLPSYIGASIDDKPAWTRRNEKLARSLHDPWVPTIHEANDLIRAWRDRYARNPSRGRSGQRPIDIFMTGKGPGVNPAELTFLMMDRDIKTIHRNGITWLGWHWYHEALYGLKNKVLIRYSLCDLSQIYVFYKNEFLCTATPVEKVHPMASETESPKEMEAVKEVIRLKKRVKDTTRKLSDLLNTKAASQIDWNRTFGQSPEVVQAIEKIETKNKKIVHISPFIDEPATSVPATSVPAASVPAASVPVLAPREADQTASPAEPSSSPLSGPQFETCWERYEWYARQDSTLLNRDDLDWIAWYEKDPEYERLFGDEASQRRLEFLRSRGGTNNEKRVCAN